MASLQGNDGVNSGILPNHPFGVWGDSGTGGNGVLGTSNQYTGIAGITTSNDNRAAGVYGAGGAVGVAGVVNGATTAPSISVGVYGSGSNDANLGGVGVHGVSDISTGVHGESTRGIGVHGESSVNGYHFGVVGKGPNAGVAAFNPNNDHAAYLASACCAAWFTGQVIVAGPLYKSGGGFLIDHPLDPAERYLAHSFVESSDMKNVYDGVALLNAAGEAVVSLPSWFESINADFRYQITAVGAPAPNLHVAKEIAANKFKISGGSPRMKVCWQVTGIRKDAWAKANPILVEAKKSAEERGHYLHPEVHGAPKEKHLGRARHAPRNP